MSKTKISKALRTLALGVTITASAFAFMQKAQAAHISVGFWGGGPYYYGRPYYAPAYYAPPPVVYEPAYVAPQPVYAYPRAYTQPVAYPVGHAPGVTYYYVP